MARKTKRKVYKRKYIRVLSISGSTGGVGKVGGETGETSDFGLGEETEKIENQGVQDPEEGGNRKTRKHKRKFKKVLCSPAKKNNVESSCYSASELVMIKNAYNKHHSKSTSGSASTDPRSGTNRIRATNPDQILKELRDKNAHCTTELCWLNAVSDRGLREKIQKETFRPLQPAEWRKKPNAWLSNFDIDAVIQQYEAAYPEFVFLGPTPIDFDSEKDDGKCVTEEICGLSLSKQWAAGKRKIGVIYNLDTSDGPGTHWVSMFMDMSDHEPYIFYFNSTAEPMPKEVRDLMDRIQEQWLALPLPKGVSHKKKLVEYTSDDKVEHQHSNTECGMYSLFFIITCLTRKVGGFQTLGSGLTREKIIEMFAGKIRIPDRYMLKFRKLYFISG